MSAQIEQSSYEPGAKLVLRVVLTESGLPVEKRAHVWVEVGKPNGASMTLGLSEVEPGVFEASMVASMAGIYPVRFRAQGTTLRGYPFTREQLRTAAVWRGGDSPPTGTTEPTQPDVDWCDLVECLLNQRSVRAWVEKAGNRCR